MPIFSLWNIREVSSNKISGFFFQTTNPPPPPPAKKNKKKNDIAFDIFINDFHNYNFDKSAYYYYYSCPADYVGRPNNNWLRMRTKINHRRWMVMITSFYASLVGNDAFEK